MSAIEAISLVLITIGTVLSLVCVATPFWKINDPEDTARDTVFQVGWFFLYTVESLSFY